MLKNNGIFYTFGTHNQKSGHGFRAQMVSSVVLVPVEHIKLEPDGRTSTFQSALYSYVRTPSTRSTLCSYCLLYLSLQ
jgi:hypothetical protein